MLRVLRQEGKVAQSVRVVDMREIELLKTKVRIKTDQYAAIILHLSCPQDAKMWHMALTQTKQMQFLNYRACVFDFDPYQAKFSPIVTDTLEMTETQISGYLTKQSDGQSRWCIYEYLTGELKFKLEKETSEIKRTIKVGNELRLIKQVD